MARDQDIVKQLRRRLQKWDPDGQCPYLFHHRDQNCEYNELGQLIRLHLCELELMQVPADVWQCLALELLWLDNNQLSTLSPEVGQLTALQRLWLDNNPLQTPPPEIVAQGVPAILYLFADVATGGGGTL